MKKCTSPSSPSFPLHYYHQDRAPSGFFFPAAVSPAEDAFSTYYNLANKLNIPDAPTASSLAPTKMKAAAHNSRKDRHSKIVTAQGPRDRRVRLSIQVARKFFDLHDTLGSDKASETIDWLLTKSQPAIDELVRIKQSSCTTGDEGCSRSDSNEAAEIRDRHYMKSKSSMILSNSIDDDTQGRRVSMQLEEKARIASLLARESRAKARARARERTRQKMCIRHLLQTNKLLPRDFRIPGNHLSTWNELSYLDKIRRPT